MLFPSFSFGKEPDAVASPVRRHLNLSALENRTLFDATGIIADLASSVDLPPIEQAQDTQQLQLAFPGAEGFGAYAQGGRGGDVYHVTNLDDSGIGSLRFGIDSMSGPRTIVFDVAGNIELNSRLTIDSPYLTIAGQTAPGDGITIANHRVIIRDTHDIIVRYVRFRAGDTDILNTEATTHDALAVYKSDNVIVDHVSMSWGADETLDVSESTNVTVQWSIVSESIQSEYHASQWHSQYNLGSLVIASSVTLSHNLYAHHDFRMPSISVGSDADVVNNVFYNWGKSTPSDVGNFGNSVLNNVNFQNNVYLAGPSLQTGLSPESVFWARDTSPVWASGNLVDVTPDGQMSFQPADFGFQPNSNATLVDSRFAFPTVTTDNAIDAYSAVLAEAGASLSRDQVDLRIVNDVKNSTGEIIDSQTLVGGLPVLANGPTLADSDQDGMSDVWELRFSNLDPTNPNDRNLDFDGDGYSNLEEYLNSIIEPQVVATATIRLGETFQWTTPVVSGEGTQKFQIDWNGDSRIDQTVNAPSGTTLSHVYNKSGVYNVTIHTTGSSGQVTTSTQELTVLPKLVEPTPDPPTPPTRSIAISNTALTNESVKVRFESHDKSMWSFQIDWNGDGRIDQTVRARGGLVAEHLYRHAGEYTVNIQASNMEGNESLSETTLVSVFATSDPVQIPLATDAATKPLAPNPNPKPSAAPPALTGFASYLLSSSFLRSPDNDDAAEDDESTDDVPPTVAAEVIGNYENEATISIRRIRSAPAVR